MTRERQPISELAAVEVSQDGVVEALFPPLPSSTCAIQLQGWWYCHPPGRGRKDKPQKFQELSTVANLDWNLKL